MLNITSPRPKAEPRDFHAWVIETFPDATPDGDGYLAFCPVHERDGGHHKSPSLKIDLSSAGHALLVCRSKGCDALPAAPGYSGPFLGSSTVSTEKTPVPVDDRRMELASKYPLQRTLRENIKDDGTDVRVIAFLDRFGLDLDSVEKLHLWFDEFLGDRIFVPAFDDEGILAFYQGRALDADVDPAKRWVSPKNVDGLVWDLYGWVGGRYADRPVVITEGVSDALTLAVLDRYEIVSVRGAGNGAKIAGLKDQLAGRDVYVVGDSDSAGQKFNADVVKALGAKVIEIPEGLNDVGDVRKGDPAGFADRFASMVAEATEATPATPATIEETTPFYQHSSIADAHMGERVGRYFLAGRFLAWGRNSWSRWDGRRWVTASDTSTRRAVRDALMEIFAELMEKATEERDKALAAAAKETDADTAKHMVAAASKNYDVRTRELRSLFNVGKIDAVMKISRGFIEIDPLDFDQHPDLLNVGNGIVDLRTGELKPHDPKLLMTKVTEVDYIPGATHSAWDTALEALPEDRRDWMQVRFGQGATGHPPEDDVVPFLKGGGANGKSTILAGIRKALGDHCVLVPDKVILGSANDHPTEMMTLKGARLALLEELPEGDYLDVNRIKKISGSAVVTARYIGENNITFPLSSSLFVTTNHNVQIKDTDHGSQRRLVLVTFPYSYSGPKKTHEGDRTLRPTIERDPRVHEAALAWIVAGAVRWYGNDQVIPEPPEIVEKDTEAWMVSSNDAARFLSDNLELDPSSCVLTSEVYSEFKEWLADTSRRPVKDQTFWQRAEAHRWFVDGDVEKKLVRTAGWDVSRSRQARVMAGPVTPARATVLTGVRWTDDAGEAGEVAA